MGIRVGIDLGTTFSAVARIDPATGKPVVVRNCFGQATTPSVLCFEPDGNILFGEDAKNLQAMGDTSAVAFFKRNMGNDLFAAEIGGRTYDATDLSAIFLKKLKEEAEAQMGQTIDSAVITVPAYFANKEREATIEAGRRAGLNVLSIINEPTAAAFAYGLNDKKGEQTIMIYDLGGGTFDVTIARINEDEIRILGSDGNHELGGKDWDDCIARYIAERFEEEYHVDLSESPEMVNTLLIQAEETKKKLTTMDSVNVPVRYQNIRGTVRITEDDFESISQFLISMTQDVIDRLFESLKMSWSGIDGVILVGGSTRMRVIQNFIYRMSGMMPLNGVNVDEAVALGAAIRANITDKGEVVPALGGRRRSEEPELLFIRGAKAVTDVTAHSMGMISVSPDGNRYMNSIIIPKNTAIPADQTQTFRHGVRGKDTELEVYVLQGEFVRPLDNTVVNKYVVTGFSATKSRTAMVDINYRYTANGVIEVTAVQQETGKKLPIRIEPVPEDMSWTDLNPQDVEPSQQEIPQDVTVLLTIDLSGSMCGTPTRMAMKAMKEFTGQMDSSTTKIGILAFAERNKMLLHPTHDYDRVYQKISQLESVDVGAGTSANPFELGGPELNGDDSEVKYMVVLTDGIWFHPKEAIKTARQCHGNNIEVMALGFGDADHAFLRKIASTDAFATKTRLEDLSGSFSKIAQAIGSGSTGLKA